VTKGRIGDSRHQSIY